MHVAKGVTPASHDPLDAPLLAICHLGRRPARRNQCVSSCRRGFWPPDRGFGPRRWMQRWEETGARPAGRRPEEEPWF